MADTGITFSQPLSSIAWGTALLDNVVTYYYAPTDGVYQTPVGYVWSSAWNAYEIQQFDLGLALFESFTQLTFTPVSTQADADFTLVKTASFPDGLLGVFGPPDIGAGAGVGAFNFNGVGWDENTPNGGLQQGGYGFSTIIHEVGHGLGLAHPHDEGGTSSIMTGVTGTSSNYSYGTYGLNQGIYTIMSYNDGWQSQLGPSRYTLYGHQGTPMALDIAVLQAIYGANTTYASGADTYTLSGTNAAGTFFSCLWDTGGVDEICYTGSTAATIDLRPATLQEAPGGGGYVSYVNGIFGGFTIANGVIIENATGGSNNDTITGNDYANTLSGGMPSRRWWNWKVA
jgi:serralysin